MKLAILGTRGIPNYYGGFEQFAEYLAIYMAKKGHEVTVYNSHNHPYRDKVFNGVLIRHCYDPEDSIGTVGQFIYDLNCILDIRKHEFDLILQLGYTSSSIWNWLLPKKSVLVTNMDGLEWKRSKFSRQVQKFLLWAESLAVKSSDALIADSIGIQDYIRSKYKRDARYIPYGANTVKEFDASILSSYGLERDKYNLIIARLEPENNIESLIEGHIMSGVDIPVMVVGKTNTPLGKLLVERYKNNSNVRFQGGIYNKEHLDVLRWGSLFYYHGHSVGGTNPSLLEAMAVNTTIIAHDNIFNRSILKDDAYYFRDKNQIAQILTERNPSFGNFSFRNQERIENEFSWERINCQYERFLKECLDGNTISLK